MRRAGRKRWSLGEEIARGKGKRTKGRPTPAGTRRRLPRIALARVVARIRWNSNQAPEALMARYPMFAGSDRHETTVAARPSPRRVEAWHQSHQLTLHSNDDRRCQRAPHEHRVNAPLARPSLCSLHCCFSRAATARFSSDEVRLRYFQKHILRPVHTGGGDMLRSSPSRAKMTRAHFQALLCFAVRTVTRRNQSHSHKRTKWPGSL